jgi:hypothetical protein
MLDVHGVKVAHVAGTFGLNGVSVPAGREWSVDIDPVPDVDGLLVAAARARAAGADVVVASLHCCVEYQNDRPRSRSPRCTPCWPRPTSTWSWAITRM